MERVQYSHLKSLWSCNLKMNMFVFVSGGWIGITETVLNESTSTIDIWLFQMFLNVTVCHFYACISQTLCWFTTFWFRNPQSECVTVNSWHLLDDRCICGGFKDSSDWRTIQQFLVEISRPVYISLTGLFYLFIYLCLTINFTFQLKKINK